MAQDYQRGRQHMCAHASAGTQPCAVSAPECYRVHDQEGEGGPHTLHPTLREWNPIEPYNQNPKHAPQAHLSVLLLRTRNMVAGAAPSPARIDSQPEILNVRRGRT